MTPEEKAVIEAAINANPIGPPPTAAQLNILRTAVHQLIFSCPECNAGGHTCPGDGNSIGHTQTNCGEHGEPDECQCSRTERVYCHVENCHGGADVAEWTPAALIDCLAGDRVRVMGDHGWEEADVLTTSADTWHVDNANVYRPKRWDHVELYMSFSTDPDVAQYPPNTPCEILCTPARAATLTMQSAFPGSVVISSDVD